MTSKIAVLSWKNIPTQVKATDESGAEHMVSLGERYQQAVDALAMQEGLAGTDEYLEHWSWSEPEDRLGTAEEAGETFAQELDRAWPQVVAQMVEQAQNRS